MAKKFDPSEITPLSTSASTDAYVPSSLTPTSDDFGPIQMDYNKPTSPDLIGPAGPVEMTPTGVEPSFETDAIDSTANAAPVGANSATATSTADATAPEPNQETLNAAFAKYMGSSYNPNSPMDKGKMETVKNALKKFQEENNKPFDINDSEDLTKMRPVMNAAYQSEEYKKVAGVGTRTGAQPSATSAAAPRQQTAAQRRATAPASPKGGPTYYVRTGFNRYVPAVEADITSGQQLFMQNPNRAARMVYPYVKVDSRPVRRATPAR